MSDRSLIRFTSAAALAAGVAIAVMPPLGFFELSRAYLRGATEQSLDILAGPAKQLIARDAGSPSGPAEVQPREDCAAKGFENVTIRHGTHRLLSLCPSAEPTPTWLSTTYRRELIEAGRFIGTIEVRRSLWPLFAHTAWIAIISGTLGFGVYVGLQLFPLRALRRAWARITFLANYDSLTGLPNRLRFCDRLGASLRGCLKPGSVGILCFDLDHFKDVNDTLGHAAGDALLRAVAARLQGEIREGDLLARLGGDEFAIILSTLPTREIAVALAQRLIDALRAPFEIGGHTVVIATSIGIAFCDGVGPTCSTDLLKHADLALYQAKAGGGARWVVFEEAMERRARERRALECDLAAAVAAGGLELQYQPLIDIRANRVVAVEALARWRHPTLGPIPPAEFIPLAEETGRIVALGARVLRDACAAIAGRSNLELAINLSPVQLRWPDVAAGIEQVLLETGFPPQRLQLEITEGVLLHDTNATLTVLYRLKRLGIRIVMDDFGTGYSSLSYLRHFPFDKIKIDRSFIQDLAGDGYSTAIVHAGLNLARTLGIRTNAEGVETAAQLACLREEGCDEVQGFFFSAPLPVEDLDDFVGAFPRAFRTVAGGRRA